MFNVSILIQVTNYFNPQCFFLQPKNELGGEKHSKVNLLAELPCHLHRIILSPFIFPGKIQSKQEDGCTELL